MYPNYFAQGGQPQPQQQDPQAQLQQILQQVEQMLQQGANPQQVMQQLVQAGIPQQQAQQVVQQAMQEMQQPQEQQQMPQQGPPQPQQQMPQEQESGEPQGQMKLGGMPYNLRMYNNIMDRVYARGGNYNNKVIPSLPFIPTQDSTDYFNQMTYFSLQDALKNPNDNIIDQRLDRNMRNGYRQDLKGKSGYNENGFPTDTMYINMPPIKKAQGGSINKYPTQEQNSRYLAQDDNRQAAQLAQQRMQFAQKVMPNAAFNYAKQNLMNTPQVRRLVNPSSIVANQTFDEGGITNNIKGGNLSIKDIQHIVNTPSGNNGLYIPGNDPGFSLPSDPRLNNIDPGFSDPKNYPKGMQNIPNNDPGFSIPMPRHFNPIPDTIINKLYSRPRNKIIYDDGGITGLNLNPQTPGINFPNSIGLQPNPGISNEIPAALVPNQPMQYVPSNQPDINQVASQYTPSRYGDVQPQGAKKFSDAFAIARQNAMNNGPKNFEWNGNIYNTDLRTSHGQATIAKLAPKTMAQPSTVNISSDGLKRVDPHPSHVQADSVNNWFQGAKDGVAPKSNFGLKPGPQPTPNTSLSQFVSNPAQAVRNVDKKWNERGVLDMAPNDMNSFTGINNVLTTILQGAGMPVAKTLTGQGDNWDKAATALAVLGPLAGQSGKWGKMLGNLLKSKVSTTAPKLLSSPIVKETADKATQALRTFYQTPNGWVENLADAFPQTAKTLNNAQIPKLLNKGTYQLEQGMGKFARTSNAINKGLPAAVQEGKTIITPYTQGSKTFYGTAKGLSENLPKLRKTSKKITQTMNTLFK